MTTKKLVISAVVLWLTGPAIIVLALLSGAELLDGLFGVYRNNPLQSFGLNSGFVLTVIGWLAAAILSIVAIFKMWHRSNRVILIVLVAISLMSFILLAPIFIQDLYYF